MIISSQQWKNSTAAFALGRGTYQGVTVNSINRQFQRKRCREREYTNCTRKTLGSKGEKLRLMEEEGKQERRSKSKTGQDSETESQGRRQRKKGQDRKRVRINQKKRQRIQESMI